MVLRLDVLIASPDRWFFKWFWYTVQHPESEDILGNLLFVRNRSLHDLLSRAAVDVLSSPDSDSSKANSTSDALRFAVLSYFTAVIAFIGRQPEASFPLPFAESSNSRQLVMKCKARVQ